MAAGLRCQHTPKVGFATARGAGEQHIVVLVDPVIAEQISKLAFLQPPRMAVIDVLRISLQLEFGGFQKPGDFVVIPIGRLPIN
jgi:hypothetical protein